MLYHHGIIEMWAATSTESATQLQQKPLESDCQSQTALQTASPANLITAGVVTSLLVLSVAALVWGTAKVTDGTAQLQQYMTQSIAKIQ